MPPVMQETALAGGATVDRAGRYAYDRIPEPGQLPHMVLGEQKFSLAMSCVAQSARRKGPG
jgi:hypothetical protein